MHQSRSKGIGWVDIRPQTLRILAVAWGLKGLVKREGHITRDSEIFKRSIDQGLTVNKIVSTCTPRSLFVGVYLLGFAGVHCRLNLPEALADEEGSIDEHAIGRAIDLEVPEQDVGTEKRQDLIDAVVGFIVGGNIDIGSIGGKRGQGVCRTTGASAQRQNWEISWRHICQLWSLGSTAHGDVGCLGVQLLAGHSYLSRGHRGPPGRWSGMPVIMALAYDYINCPHRHIRAL